MLGHPSEPGSVLLGPTILSLCGFDCILLLMPLWREFHCPSMQNINCQELHILFQKSQPPLLLSQTLAAWIKTEAAVIPYLPR